MKHRQHHVSSSVLEFRTFATEPPFVQMFLSIQLDWRYDLRTCDTRIVNTFDWLMESYRKRGELNRLLCVDTRFR